MDVPIVTRGAYLIANVPGALSDAELRRLQLVLAERFVTQPTGGVIVDVTAVDVIDSFATRTLCEIVRLTRMQGAEAVIVGIRPDVVLAMSRLDLPLDSLPTAPDLERGLALLEHSRTASHELGQRDEVCVWIRAEADIVLARQRTRALAARIGLESRDRTLLATAISELARNILQYAGEGEIAARAVHEGGRQGITVRARDHGPGIANVRRALDVGYSTSGGLGLGLPGVRRLMDELEIDSEPGRGTVITARKWHWPA